MTPSGLLAGLAGSSATDGDGSLAVPPPFNFRPAGTVKSAWFCSAPVIERTPRGYAKKVGLRYEKKAQEKLRESFPEIRINPWIQFTNHRGQRYCRPDAFLLTNGDLLLFEIKVNHCPEAYWQLRHLYLPVLSKMFTVHKACCIEVVRSYDPSTPFPEKHRLIQFKDVWDLPSGVIGVVEWKP